MSNQRFYNRPQKDSYSGITVNFQTPKVVKEIPASNITVSKIEITSIEDSSSTKTVTAYTKGYPFKIILWTGAAYDAIGQWTDADVTSRIHQLYP